MKLTLTHHNHEPSDSIVEMIGKELKSLQPDLQIDEARVHLERSLSGSPPFSASIHLVTPGPDVTAQATDHTLRAALLKAVAGVRARIEHRNQKLSRRREAAPAIELTRRRPSGSQRR
jgi:ribosome-associated translation inhibitor RaiA